MRLKKYGSVLTNHHSHPANDWHWRAATQCHLEQWPWTRLENCQQRKDECRQAHKHVHVLRDSRVQLWITWQETAFPNSSLPTIGLYGYSTYNSRDNQSAVGINGQHFFRQDDLCKNTASKDLQRMHRLAQGSIHTRLYQRMRNKHAQTDATLMHSLVRLQSQSGKVDIISRGVLSSNYVLQR